MDTSFFHRKLSALIRLRICWICHWRWKILNATYSIFALIINHLQLKVDAGFFHLKYVFIEYHPIEVEGGRYGRSCSIHFNTFLPKRGHQTVKCPMATLLFILWLIIRQLPFEGVPIGPFSVQWARSTTGRQLSERCLYFLTIPVLCPQRKIFDTVVLLPIPSTLQPKPQPWHRAGTKRGNVDANGWWQWQRGWLKSQNNSLRIQYLETRSRLTTPKNKKKGLD